MILLVAKEQMRYATSMEAAAADKVSTDLNLASKRTDRAYLDVTDPDAKPIVKKKVRKFFLKK